MLELNIIIGIVGMTFILTGFILDEFFKRYNQDTIFYNVINIVGSAMLTYYAITLKSVPFIILNVVWFITACYKLVRIYIKLNK